MKISVALDKDNAVRLERLRKQRDTGTEDIVNDVMRCGLDAIEARAPHRTRTADLGKPLFSSPEELKELIAQIQEEEDLEKLNRSRFPGS